MYYLEVKRRVPRLYNIFTRNKTVQQNGNDEKKNACTYSYISSCYVELGSVGLHLCLGFVSVCFVYFLLGFASVFVTTSVID